MEDVIWGTPFTWEHIPIMHPFTHTVVGHELVVTVHSEALLEYIRRRTRLDLYGVHAFPLLFLFVLISIQEKNKVKFYKIEMLLGKLNKARNAKVFPYCILAEFIDSHTKEDRETAQKYASPNTN